MRAACALVAILLLACTRTSEVRQEDHRLSDETAQSSTENRSTGQAASASTETRSQAPTEVDTNVERKDLAVIAQDADGGITIARVGRTPVTLPAGSKVIGTVPLTDVTTAREEHRGALVDEKASSASSTSTAEAKGASSAAKVEKEDSSLKKATKTEAGTSWLLWLGIGAGLAAAVALLWKLGLVAKWAATL